MVNIARIHHLAHWHKNQEMPKHRLQNSVYLHQLRYLLLPNHCKDIQWNTGDFTTYCYDYNDVGSSPWFRSPYKIRLEYIDL